MEEGTWRINRICQSEHSFGPFKKKRKEKSWLTTTAPTIELCFRMIQSKNIADALIFGPCKLGNRIRLHKTVLRNLGVVKPSQFLEECLGKTAYFKDFPKHVAVQLGTALRFYATY